MHVPGPEALTDHPAVSRRAQKHWGFHFETGTKSAQNDRCGLCQHPASRGLEGDGVLALAREARALPDEDLFERGIGPAGSIQHHCGPQGWAVAPQQRGRPPTVAEGLSSPSTNMWASPNRLSQLRFGGVIVVPTVGLREHGRTGVEGQQVHAVTLRRFAAALRGRQRGCRYATASIRPRRIGAGRTARTRAPSPAWRVARRRIGSSGAPSGTGSTRRHPFADAALMAVR